jgi:hypothetical protein
MGFIPTETNVASSYNIRYYVYCMWIQTLVTTICPWVAT